MTLSNNYEDGRPCLGHPVAFKLFAHASTGSTKFANPERRLLIL